VSVMLFTGYPWSRRPRRKTGMSPGRWGLHVRRRSIADTPNDLPRQVENCLVRSRWAGRSSALPARPQPRSWTDSAASLAVGHCWCRWSASPAPSNCSPRRTLDASRALDPDHRHPDGSRWSPPAPRSRRVLPAGPPRVPRPVPAAGACWRSRASRISPLLPGLPSESRSERPTRSWFACRGHFAPFLHAHEQAVQAELAFLHWRPLGRSADDRPAPGHRRCSAARRPTAMREVHEAPWLDRGLG
jgi:hypothetical protein